MVCDILHIYHALCNMPHALCFTPCLVHHAPFYHALCPMAFQQCNCDIAPTLLCCEWGHSAQIMVLNLTGSLWREFKCPIYGKLRTAGGQALHCG